jgi:hypothetical protein
VNEEWHKAEPSLGWQKFAMGGIDVYPIPGDHDHCVPDNIPRVAEILKECLTEPTCIGKTADRDCEGLERRVKQMPSREEPSEIQVVFITVVFA